MAISIKVGTFTGEKEELGKSVTWLNNSTPIDCQLVNTSLTDPVLKLLAGKVNFNYIEITQKKEQNIETEKAPVKFSNNSRIANAQSFRQGRPEQG